MIYIYDKPMTNEVKSFKRYGVQYKFEKKFRMGDRRFYTFIANGHEKLLVVPNFAEQYVEVENIFKKFPKGKLYSEYIRIIRKKVSKEIKLESFPSEKSETGKVEQVQARYKDITVSFEYMNGKLEYSDEFEIVDNNIFGNGIIVLMNVNMEE